MNYKSLFNYLTTLSTFGISQLVAVGAALIRIPLIIHYLGVTNFGILVTMSQIFPLLNILTVSTRIKSRIHFSRSSDSLDLLLKNSVHLEISTAVRVGNWIGMITVLLLFIVKKVFAEFSQEIHMSVLALMTTIGFTSTTLLFGTLYGLYDVRGKQNFISGFDLVSSVISVPLTLFGIKQKLGTDYFFFVTSLTFIMPGFILAILEWKLFKNMKSKDLKKWEYIKQNLKFANQNIGNIIGNGFNLLIISKLIGFTDAALYSICEKIFSGIAIPNGALAPLQFTEMAKNSKNISSQKRTRHLLTRVIKLNLIFSASVAVILCSIFPILFNILSRATLPIPILIGTVVAINNLLFATFTSFFPYLSVSGGYFDVVILPLLNGIFSLLLSLLLVSKIGVLGAPVSGMCVNGLCILYLIKKYHLKSG